MSEMLKGGSAKSQKDMKKRCSLKTGITYDLIAELVTGRHRTECSSTSDKIILIRNVYQYIILILIKSFNRKFTSNYSFDLRF